MLRPLLALVLFACFSWPAWAEPIAPVRLELCSLAPTGTVTPAACRSTKVSDVDPQDRLIELRAWFDIPAERSERIPLALYLSGKGASLVWLNGTVIGRNGRPGASTEEERAGRMDSQFYLPPSLLNDGVNQITIRLSAQRGLFRLGQPIHAILIDRYQSLGDRILRLYWPALITFGAFLVAALYFGAVATGGMKRGDSLLLALLSLFAAGQLLAEVLRGLWLYPYPVHDLRLLAILLCAFGFGSCLTAHLWRRFRRQYWVRATLAVQGAVLIAILLTPYFDLKTVLASLLPTLAGIVLVIRWLAEGRPGAGAYLIALVSFALLILVGPFGFLDTAFYYSVAALLGFLFVQQAQALVLVRKERVKEAARSARLNAALDQARERMAPSPIRVQDGSRTLLISTDRLIRCQGARDYVELFLDGGASLLHSGSLNELEKTLPDTFLRVHRSHIVNSAFIDRLERDLGGTGTLTLNDGSDVPVSRRTMPHVKSQLA